MKLIGMLDSPYVRRVAVSLQLLGLRFEHEPLSVFRTFEQFRRINPVVEAPTLVCDDGTVLLDSTLILEYAEALVRPRSLLPANPQALARELRLIGLALAACDKSVQIVYEHELRPREKLHAPWLERVTGQLHAAFDALEQEQSRQAIAVTGGAITQAGVSTAIAWHFAQQMVPEAVPASAYPRLAMLSAEAEALPEFRAAPHGAGICEARG
ncbi:MAG: glutathione S-transferase [Pseudomonadota bacterium]